MEEHEIGAGGDFAGRSPSLATHVPFFGEYSLVQDHPQPLKVGWLQRDTGVPRPILSQG